MKKKTTKGAKKAKVRDLPAKKTTAGVKGGASNIVSAKGNLQLDTCWIEGVRMGRTE